MPFSQKKELNQMFAYISDKGRFNDLPRALNKPYKIYENFLDSSRSTFK